MKGTKKQKQALKYLTDDKTKVIVYGGAAGGGKSFLGCIWLLFMASAYPNSRWFIGREELKRIRQSTLITWHKVCKSFKFEDYKINFQDNYIQLGNGSRIDLLDLRYLPSDPLYERFGSTEYTGGWIEEGGETNFGAFDVLKTRVGRHMNQEYDIVSKVLVTCNPKKNWIYDIYKRWREDRLLDSEQFIQALVQDNPYLTEDYIENLKNTKDKSKYERLFNGNWEYDDDPDSLIDDYDKILNIFNNIHVQEGVKYITADIARYGSDKAVIFVWSDFKVIDFKVFETSSTTDIQNAINKFRTKYNIPSGNVVCDEDGVGGGVVDSLRCKGFVNNSKPMKIKGKVDEYQNLKTQCSYMLAELINDDKLWISCNLGTEYIELLKEELEQLKRYKSDNDGKLRVLPKEKVKELIGRSPDFLDALMMRLYFEVNKQNIRAFTV